MSRAWYVGDYGQVIRCRLMDGAVPHNLTGATVWFDFYCPAASGAIRKAATPGALAPYLAADGWCEYTLESSLFVEGRDGNWFCTIELIKADGTVWHEQFYFKVLPQGESNR